MKAPNEKGAEPASRAQKVRTNAKSTVHPSKSTPAYGSSTIKRTRRTKNELGCLDGAIVRIVQDQRPMTVRQCFYQGTVHGLVPKDEAKGYRVIQRRLVALRESERIPYGWVTDNIRWAPCAQDKAFPLHVPSPTTIGLPATAALDEKASFPPVRAPPSAA